jgi:hypothetical protein
MGAAWSTRDARPLFAYVCSEHPRALWALDSVNTPGTPGKVVTKPADRIPRLLAQVLSCLGWAKTITRLERNKRWW